ncbi:hypothetical protein [Actinocrispum sp. NPDC049592]|uniref:hypothetical protein n=1 Tax=Actinocrispum sp. NPDC049592 TaxID=3154835 RepID=UPI00343FA848
MNERVVAGTAGFVAVAGLGLVNNYTARALGTSTLRDAWHWTAIVAAITILAVLALRVWWRTAWAWLVLAGAALGLPVVLAPASTSELVALAALVSPTLLILGTLATAAWIGQAGHRGLGAALAATTVAMPTLGLLVLNPPVSVLAAISLCGAIGAVSMVRFAVHEERLTWTTTGIGALAALTPLAITEINPWIILAILLVAALAGGIRPALGAVVIVLVGIATVEAISMTVYSARLNDTTALFLAFAGVAAGLAATVTRYRVWIAAGALIVTAVLIQNPTLPLVFVALMAIVAKTGAVADLMKTNASVYIGLLAPAVNAAAWATRSGGFPRSGWETQYGIMLAAAAVLLAALTYRQRAMVA